MGPAETAGFTYVKDLATEGTKTGVSYMWNQAGYSRHYKKMVNDLKRVVSKLVAHKLDIEKTINACEDNSQVTHVAEKWLSEVTDLEVSVEEIDKKCESIKQLQLSQRYKIGKNSEKLMTKAINLVSERNGLVILSPCPVARFSSRPPKDFNEYFSMRVVLEKVIDELKDAKNSILAIYGMGGIGKSTLIDQIGRRMEKDKVFDVVLSVELSRTPSLNELQNHIAEQLGKEFTVDSVEQKSSELARALKRKNSVLIMLDNVWTEVDLKKVGVPFGEDHKGCKILISTRKIEVCNDMNVANPNRFSVNLLTEQDSWDLFKSKTGVFMDSEIEKIAKDVARECGNLPLALVVVGKALQGANKSETWCHALKQLRQSNPNDLVNVEEKLFKCLQLSYEHLEYDNRKLLFLLCSLFPEHYELGEDELMRIGLGEDMLGTYNTLEEARHKMHVLVSSLINSCLLLRNKKVETAEMHDVVRDVAIYIGSRVENGFFAEHVFGTNKNLEKAFIQYKRISLMNSRISQLPSNPIAPNLSVLFVRNNQHLDNLPDNFFRQMAMLTVLDLSDSSITKLPSSMQYLRRLKVLLLNRCKVLKTFSIIRKLENLHVLSLQSSPMESLPKEIGELTNLKLLDLSSSADIKVPPKILSKLRFLEELYLDSSSLTTAVLIEITSLKRLNCLQLYVKDNNLFSQEVVPAYSMEKLKRFFLYSEISWVKMPKYYKKNLYMKGIKTVAPWVEMLLRGTEDLSFHSCFSNVTPLLNFANFEPITGFINLKILRVSKCHCIGYLLWQIDAIPKDVFINLQELYLNDLDNLNGISRGNLSSLSFRKIRKIHISGCKSMFSLMPYTLLVGLQNSLEELTVKNCEELRIIFYFESHEISSASFSRLKLLYLCDLPKLNNIWYGTGISQGSFANLKYLHVQGCNGLIQLIPASVVSGFQCLEMLLVSESSTMKQVISDDGFELQQDAFPRLMELSLEYLPNLKSFYNRNQQTSTFSWPLLEKLKIGGCQAMEMLPIRQDSAPKLYKIELLKTTDLVWYNRLHVNDTITSSRFQPL